MITNHFKIGLLYNFLQEAVRPRVTRRNAKKLYEKYVYVESSNIHSIYYNKKEKEMRVRFLNGSEYVYFRVPERIWIQLLNADSHGSSLWELVKNVFRYDRLADWDQGQATNDNEGLPIRTA